MSKEEQIKMHEGIIEDQRKIVAVLREEIEAEKSKHRHGDFGYDDDLPRLTLEDINGELFTAGAGSCETRKAGGYHPQHPKLILGNIFNLLKEWSEPFKGFKVLGDCNFIGYVSCMEPDKIHLRIESGESSYTLPELEELWHGLGRGIAHLKRKQK